MNDERQRRSQARQLQRLRALRAERAQRERAEAQRAQQQALAAVRAAEAEFDARRQALKTLLAARNGGAVAPRWQAYAEARRAALDEAAERAEYALLDEQEALDAADRRLDRARAAWREALSRRQATDEAGRDALAAWRRALEAAAERQDPAPRIQTPSFLPGAPR